MVSKIIFKNDKYKKNRGGYSRLLSLTCDKCKTPIFLYQKDGPGMLKRLYLDRIIAKEKISGKNLICNKCKMLLGIRIIYQKENRPAYRLFAGAVGKKIVKLVELKK